MPQDTDILTTGEAARLARVSVQTIINWAEEKRFPCERIGTGPRRIARAEFHAYLKAQGSTGTGGASTYPAQVVVAHKLAQAVVQAFRITQGEIVGFRSKFAADAVALAKQYMDGVRITMEKAAHA